ncbi:MAG TPA: isopentenyl transferase family protein, partial [Planococcus sp. (in: firmicutes)]|nr:isopentenyl transferase family protein [Planococcus sp. (in: firmicutes)]
MIDVLAIVGPTASGKTALSIKMAEELNGEIINGDSMQVYKEMSIGTAKITPDEMKGIPHHLLDIKDPAEAFSVAEYQQLVRKKIEEIQ